MATCRPSSKTRCSQPGERRKVILATNVAETSLTIEGVTGVVDSGLARMLRYDERTGLDRLELSPISQASAEQRAGRAGRTQPGVCLRLWPEAAHRSRPEFELPEIARVDLAGAVLQVLCWIEPDLAAFPWFEPPPAGAIERARQLAASCSALPTLAASRRWAGRSPRCRVHPRIGRLLIEGAAAGRAARSGAGGRAALGARSVSASEPAGPAPRSASIKSRSDVLDRVHALEQFEQAGASESRAGHAATAAPPSTFCARATSCCGLELPGRTAGTPSDDEEAFLRSLLAAYPDRLARRREPGSRRGVMVGGRGVRLADEVALPDEELFLCIDVDAGGGEALVRQASAVDADLAAGGAITTETIVEFDEASEQRHRPAADPLRGSGAGRIAGRAARRRGDRARSWPAAAAARLDRAFPADDSAVADFRARVQCLARVDARAGAAAARRRALRGLLPQLCRRPPLAGRAARRAVAAGDEGSLHLAAAADDRREAPERIEVPSGSRIAVQYEPGRPPILAVRIQEVFGLLETPRIAGGRVPVLMHLLAPNMRVAQVTDDLASFWANTYALVRKDLRARYPKHAWPEDPYTAQAERRPRRKS